MIKNQSVSKEVKDNKRLGRNGLKSRDQNAERIVHLPKFRKFVLSLL